MSNKGIFFTFFITLSIISAQPTFTEHVISTIALGANTVYAVDLDGDSDLDVLSASYNDNKIAWYENDGSEIFTNYVSDHYYELDMIDKGEDVVRDH